MFVNSGLDATAVERVESRSATSSVREGAEGPSIVGNGGSSALGSLVTFVTEGAGALSSSFNGA